MYIVIMPNVTIYVSQELFSQLRAADIPISGTCQAALWDRLNADGHRRPGAQIPGQLTTNQEGK